MVHATIRILIPPKRRAEVLDIFSSVAERSRFEEGCIHCRVYQDVESEPVFLLDQLWESREDLERHLRSEEFRKVLLVLEMSLEPPEVQFEEIAHTSGMEAIEKARSFKEQSGHAGGKK
jgi:quinol monooxygenase YgiN